MLYFSVGCFSQQARIDGADLEKVNKV